MKKFLSILTAAVLTLSMCSVSFAELNVSENTITPPTSEEVESLSLYSQMLESEDPPAFVNSLTPQEILLLNIQVGKAVDNEQADIDVFICTIGPLCTEVLPLFKASDYETYLISSYPDSFKYALIDTLDNINIDETLIAVANSTDVPSYLQVSAACSISDSTNKIEILENLYDSSDNSRDKNILLKNLSLEDMDLAATKAQDIVNSYGNVDLMEFALADRIMIRALDSYDTSEATAILETNKNILKSTDDPLVIEVCLQALAEYDDERAAEVVLQNVELTDQYGAYFFVNQNFDNLTTYLDSVEFSQTVKCVEATPVEEFKPYLQAKLRTKSADVTEEEVQRLIDIIDMSDSNDVTTFAYAKGRQGLAAYRNGVVGTYVWHAAIANAEVVEPDFDSPYAFIQATGDGHQVEYVSYDEFMGKPIYYFEGYYNKGAGTRTRMEILDVARDLTSEGIDYCFTDMLRHDSDGPDIIIPEIIEMRCDGVVEYCYEVRGVRLMGNNSFWDISTVNGCKQHNLAYGCTPEAQAALMYLVDANV